jgi:hypothetical protein
MKAKQSLQNRIRGWFPADPAFNAGSPKTALKIRKTPPTTRERLVGGLGALGGGLISMGIMFSFVPTYSHQLAFAILITGIPVLAAAVLVGRTNKKSARIQDEP